MSAQRFTRLPPLNEVSPCGLSFTRASGRALAGRGSEPKAQREPNVRPSFKVLYLAKRRINLSRLAN